MLFQKNAWLKLGLGCFVWGSWLSVSLLAQANPATTPPAPPEASATQAIVSELRQLRQAIERTTFNQYRVTIAVERVRLQQETVTRLARDWEAAQRSLNDLQANRPNMSERAKELEQLLSTEIDPQRRRSLENDLKEFKTHLERFDQHEQRERSRETELRTQLELERSKLSELNERLDALEREFEKGAANSAPTGSKRE